MPIQIIHQNDENVESNPGVFIDIDGVVLNGGRPFDWSKEAVHKLWNNQVPFVFVTNGTYCSAKLVNNLTKIFDLPFTNDHVVVAPSPCMSLTQYHDKHVLVCCQDDSKDLVEELGFSSFMTVQELAETFPELDYVDHNKRVELLNTTITQEMLDKQARFKPIECILLLGEPVNWECSLQLILDVLMTNGDPRKKFKFVPSPHLPVIACNKDLTFKGAAALPRFGHGAFLECLEALYKKVTQNDLVYEQLMGKPYIITYQYATDQIQKLAKPGQHINKFYIVGDNPDVDIYGGNNYKEYLRKLYLPKYPSHRRESLADVLQRQASITEPDTKHVETILVSTGVYNPNNDIAVHLKQLFIDSNNNDTSKPTDSSDMGGSDPTSEKAELRRALSRKNSFINYFENKMNIPDLTVDTVLDAVNYIVEAKNN